MVAREHRNHVFWQQVVEDENSRRGAAAQSRVERGQVSRARHELIGAPLAPHTSETLDELRARRPQESSSPISREVMDFAPESLSNEILRVCLDDAELLGLLCSAAEDFARAAMPGEAMRPFMLASMTALQKRDGGVRGTGTSFRRLVAKTLARQFGREVEEACSPFQFALSTRAGVDCVGHAVRVATGRCRGHSLVHLRDWGLMITCIGAPC